MSLAEEQALAIHELLLLNRDLVDQIGGMQLFIRLLANELREGNPELLDRISDQINAIDNLAIKPQQKRIAFSIATGEA